MVGKRCVFENMMLSNQQIRNRNAQISSICLVFWEDVVVETELDGSDHLLLIDGLLIICPAGHVPVTR